ncbi:PaaI family thioesterase [Phreatobacter aquaticus]|uniref:PaaI family thioesterase n=1 Tax=Phreatobacter aquaticus TaxID=2570229 RepID=A0A4D7QR42_9HYPH|nr:PaaI family thioesterase [Phreatobacter aquaticus]QCK87714.1 PaaI family thioesterase [Phreatobacter aquaticus]
MTTIPPKMTAVEMESFLEREFPQVFGAANIYVVEAVAHRFARMRCRYHHSQLRPGGTISGPTMMTLADTGLYVAILASIGPVALAVTTNLNVNFLKKPEQKDLIAECRLIKLGRRLAVGEVAIWSDGAPDDLVAHATGTYSIPPDR